MLCHRNVLHACMRLTFVRATCAMPCPLKPSCTAALCLHGQIFAQGVPVHCLAIDWLCIATLQSRHKSATQLTPASPYLIRWYSGKSAKNQEHCVWHQLLIPVCKSVPDTNSQKSDFGLMMYTVDIIIVWFWNMVLEYFFQMQKLFEEDLKNILVISYPRKI